MKVGWIGVVWFLGILAPGPAHAADDTFIFGSVHAPMNLDPAAVTHMEPYKIIELALNGLVKVDPGGYDIVPDLALSWRVSQDRRTWTFKLRRGVRFHDGAVFDAEAVVLNFKRQIDPKYPGYSSLYTYGRLVYANVLEVRATAPDEVVFVLDRPFAPFLAALATSCGKIVSPLMLRDHPRRLAKTPAGTGPFQLVSVRDRRIELKRNEAYWAGPPQIQYLTFKQFDNPREALLELKLGQIHATDIIPAAMLSEISNTEGLALSLRPGFNVVYLAMNTTKPPLDNVLVRRAINYAVNRRNLVKLVYQGYADPALSPVPPELWGHRSPEDPYEYNPQKARDLLAQAGLPDGFEVGLWVNNRPWYPAGIEKMIKANLEAVGIHTRIQINDLAAHRKVLMSGAHQIAINGWSGDTLDPDSFLWHLFASESCELDKPLNYAFFRNPQLDELLKTARERFDRAEREAAYAKAQALIHQFAPWVPIAHTQLNLVYRENVTGLIQYPNGLLNFDAVTFR